MNIPINLKAVCAECGSLLKMAEDPSKVAGNVLIYVSPCVWCLNNKDKLEE